MSTLGSFRPVVNLSPDRPHRLTPVHYLDRVTGLPRSVPEDAARETVRSDFYVDEFRHLVLRFQPNELRYYRTPILSFHISKSKEADDFRMSAVAFFP